MAVLDDIELVYILSKQSTLQVRDKHLHIKSSVLEKPQGRDSVITYDADTKSA
jgi:hypothetical protein